MLEEIEVRNWRKLELERLDAMVDVEDRIRQRIAISTLDGVLND